ncbi:protein of unknown function DUF552 [Desulforamulus reducens MI-1]|uniref:Cell division protein SepF 2 n=1 Tax=Desulforamulus reducens (strain ATCC BAA-1160 / DSM 100696 / MI-1) TaxID=349161 RepID=SEPF2_DESRM|nr:cell division protein SepF [Desulforamulus reducens]A4J451.1 RecName: Full=Cell division protein SepF 2 [Desulforamulus reducens MI-1]ABO49854.1 protein of unknown function DUF552 [Desulforamulus reducens MI-1]
MSKAFLDKFLNFIGFEEVEDSEKAPELSSSRETKTKNQNQSKSLLRSELTAVPAPRSTKIISTQPRTFTDVQTVAEHLKNGQPVVVNLSQVHPEEAQRILDYTSGVAFALDGSAKKINGEIFLFVPSGVDIVGAGDLRTFNENVEPLEEKVNSRWFKTETA